MVSWSFKEKYRFECIILRGVFSKIIKTKMCSFLNVDTSMHCTNDCIQTDSAM